MESPRDFEEDKAFLTENLCSGETEPSPNKRRSIRFYVLFSLLNIIIACITVYSNATAFSRHTQVPGWDTELQDARRFIEYEERAYTGALTYDAEKREIVRLNDSDLEFFGPPSASIDDAWQYLLHGSLKSIRVDSLSKVTDVRRRRVPSYDRRRGRTICSRTANHP